MGDYFRRVAVLGAAALVMIAANAAVAQMVWREDFDLPSCDGKGASGPGNRIDLAGVDGWTVDLGEAELATSNCYLKVVNPSFEFRNLDRECAWRSTAIDIAAHATVDVSLVISEVGDMEDSDYVHTFYRLDGGPEQPFAMAGQLSNDFVRATVQQDGLSGSRLELVVRALNSADDEKHRIECVTVAARLPPVCLPVTFPVWINELHYDNAGIDTNEGVEIAGAAGVDLAAYRLYFYDGNNGLVDGDPLPLAGAIDNEGDGYGARWFSRGGAAIQNGPADGVALAYVAGPVTAVVQFLSYEGALIASNGPAAGQSAEAIACVETANTGVDCSLQLAGRGRVYTALAWAGPFPHSRDRLNPCQVVRRRGFTLTLH